MSAIEQWAAECFDLSIKIFRLIEVYVCSNVITRASIGPMEFNA